MAQDGQRSGLPAPVRGRRFSLLSGIASVWSELRKVTWPSFSYTVRLTVLVLVFSLFLGVLFGLGVDNLFRWLVGLIAGT